MVAVKLQRFGKSIGVILPEEILSALGVAEGDTICVIETSDGYRITRNDTDFERQMKVAQRVMERDSNMLRDLATKSGSREDN